MTGPTRTDEPGIDQRINDDFLDLLTADDDWINAEFDAIIAAGWNPGADDGKPSGRRPPADGSPSPTGPPQGSAGGRPRRPSSTAATPARGRGRAPPARDN